ncbi:uncharacterized protein LOC122964679 [Acropora millepora]|uniref:uncharacterized protein LOC122964679 n=1 Tax=Acropora millepora TaxID=45264 RepID=UPI001CF22424|nr:uncharacterized protein LOC122964679 [Acropora millepora]
MVHCCVPECTNHSAKTKLVSYHKIPKDSKLKKTWISRLRRDNLPTLENCYVCSDHFQSECFQTDLREQLTGERGRRRLKSDAVPSIFNFSTSNRPSKRRSTTELRSLQKQRKQTVRELLISTNPSSASAVNEDIDIQVTPEDTCMSVPDNIATSFTREASTQCCFDRSYVITANASTQTENVSDNAKVENNCLPTEKLDCNNLWLLKHDHPYAKSKVDHDTSSPQKPGPPLYASDEGNEKEEEDIDVDFDDNDSDVHFSFHDLQSSTQTDTDPETAEDNHVEEEKYLVFHSCLSWLFKYCMNCREIVADVKYSGTGSLVSVTTTCMKGHDITWDSQPILNNRSPVGNLLLSSSILFTGNTFNAMKNFATCLNLKFLSERSFYHIQERYLFPSSMTCGNKTEERLFQNYDRKLL